MSASKKADISIGWYAGAEIYADDPEIGEFTLEKDSHDQNREGAEGADCGTGDVD